MEHFQIDLLKFLEEKVDQYNVPGFIEDDPVSIPHQFSKKEDIEIAGFLTAIISWGTRKTILKNSEKLIKLMDESPSDFLRNLPKKDFILAKHLKPFDSFVHRTFNGTDCIYFIKALSKIYVNCGGLEMALKPATGESTMKNAINRFRTHFFSFEPPSRTSKHLGDPMGNSACKRLNMFLRWMIRKDKRNVDFGLWKNFHNPSQLLCPLDLHSGNVARKLGLLMRKQNDWKAVEELTSNLRLFDSGDPVKYDFALFGLGVNQLI